MSQTKLSDAEVGLLKQLQTEFDTTRTTLGQLETQLQSILIQKDIEVDKLKSIFKEEQELADTLKAKYGEGTVDLAQGVFTPA